VYHKATIPKEDLESKPPPSNLRKNILVDEKKRGHKTSKHKLEEIGALLVDFGQAIWISEKYFSS
jgi:hypothetical protein